MLKRLVVVTNFCCTSVYSQVPVILDRQTFLIDFYVLPLSGAEVVLGIQWLKTLGPITTDYSTLTMQFQWDGILVSLQRINDGNMEAISSCHIQATHVISECYHLQLTTTTSCSSIDYSKVNAFVLPLL